MYKPFIRNIPITFISEVGIDTKGVYVIHNQQGEPVYIGQTKRLRGRLQEHFKRQSYPYLYRRHDFYSLTFYAIEGSEQREEFEAHLIKQFKPKYNDEKHLKKIYA